MNRIKFTTLALLLIAVIYQLLPTSLVYAHSLDSSTLTINIEQEVVEAEVYIALENLDKVLGTDYSSQSSPNESAETAINYVDQHFSITGLNGQQWPKTFKQPVQEQIEDNDYFKLPVTFDAGLSNPNNFTIKYDAIIEADPKHRATIVLNNQDDEVKTVGILSYSRTTIDIGEVTTWSSMQEMIKFGIHHVLIGLDHILFLVMLLLAAPLVAVNKRWQRSNEIKPVLKNVFHIVSAFTLGHSLTLIITALGWINLPSQPIEIIIAISVAISALHVAKPLTEKGEVKIAFGFGLIHGMAFAGVLSDLGIDTSNSIVSLLAFNTGIELAQLLVALAIFPSIYLVSLTKYYRPIRTLIASLTIAIALVWAADRLGLISNALSPIEDFITSNLLIIAVVSSALSLGLSMAAKRNSRLSTYGPHKA